MMSIPDCVATMARVARPVNKPCSTTPGILSNASDKRNWISNEAKRCINDMMCAIGNEGPAMPVFAQRQAAFHAKFIADLFKRQPGRAASERIDLDGQRKGAESIDEFGVIGDHNHAVRSRCNDLFAQQGSACTLDQIERGIDLVGTVDGQVQLRCFFQRR